MPGSRRFPGVEGAIGVPPDEERSETPKGIDQIFNEHPARYDSAGNGEVENAIRRFTGLLRTLKLCLEKRLQRRIPSEHKLMSWLVEHAAWILTTRIQGVDGLTAYHRIRGREYAKRGVAWGESVQFKLPSKGPTRREDESLDRRWLHAVVLGYSRTSHEYWVYYDGKAMMVRSIQRVPLNVRWNPEEIEAINVSRHDRHQPRGVQRRLVPDGDLQEHAQGRRPHLKGMPLKKGDFITHGYTAGCPRCDHAERHGWGQSTLSHSKACRDRIMDAIFKTPGGKRRVEMHQQREVRWQDPVQDAAAGEGEIVQAPRPQGQGMVRPVRPQGQGMVDRGHIPDGRFEKFDGAQAPGDDVRARSCAPPGRARVRAPDPAPEDPGWMKECMDDYDAYGNRSPQTPTPERFEGDGDSMYSPSPPLSPRDGQDVDMEMADIEPMLSLCAGDEGVRQRLQQDADEVLKLIRDLGGSRAAYKRERLRAVRAIVAEVYSAPRVTQAAKLLPSLKVLPGFALDLTTCDEAGKAWDFDKHEMRVKARGLIAEQKPYVLIGSPQCTAYSSLKAMHAAHADPELIRREKVRADMHMRFVTQLYEDQLHGGRYFLHEHPAYATSWSLECVQKILAMDGVDQAVADQCQYDQQDRDGTPIKKPTRFMSNSPEILKQLSRRCQGRSGRCTRPAGGQHTTCAGRAARLAAVYPFELCKSILLDCRNQLRVDGMYVLGIVGIQPKPTDGMTDEQLQRRVMRLLNLEEEAEDVSPGAQGPGAGPESPQELLKVSPHGPQLTSEGFRDDLTGQELEPELVRAARREELEYFDSKGVYPVLDSRKVRPSQFSLALDYTTGNGVLKDNKEAAKWYRKAADQGDADAQFLLGNIYYDGEGVLKDYKEAVRWYRKAAEQGDPNAQDSLGLMYANGEGVLKDSKEAVKWYRKAAEQGHADAQGRVGVHYYLGEGVLKDDVAAFVWFNLAAFNGAEDGPKARDSLAKEMTLAQIAEAKKLTKELLKKVEANKKKE